MKRDNVPESYPRFRERASANAAPRAAVALFTMGQPLADTTGMMATIQSGTAIILLVAGSQHACRVKPVATGWAASLTIS